MKVVIVAKTRMGAGACIGALTFDGRSLRLIAADQSTNEQFNLEYEIGDVWDVDCTPDPHLLPPHVENVIVYNKRKLPPLDGVLPFIQIHLPPRAGGLDVLYDGLTQATKAGALYIAARSGVPAYSTLFWQPDQPLRRDDDAKRVRYRYPAPDGGRTLTFVGFQEPLAEIPAGAVLRVSLAHWWRPAELPDGELRCYVQLSGWFLPPTAPSPQPLPAATPVDKRGEPESVDETAVPHLLRSVFGYDTFRPLQAEIVQNLLAQRDTLAIMPTGSGKSLCYQLPALIFPGLTVVVSPLISLMQDQVEQLHELGVAAAFLNSTLSYGEYLAVTNRIRQGQVKLLYAAPETLLRPETLLLLSQVRVDCLTIDEAHCISSWGHDFRPEYRQLLEVRRRVPTAVVLAVTATATQRVRQDIKQILGIGDAGEFIASFDRENLFLSVQPRVNGLAQLLAFLADHREQSGIIYCSTRKQTDQLCAELAQRGWEALPYHAGLDDATRRDNQRRFVRDDAPIMVATIAFGMGINKPNLRFVVHYNLPENVESYYQQIGRAGRDGLRADCLLLYGAQDVGTIQYFISEMAPAQQPGATARLQALLRYVEARECRRRPLLAYFDEEYGRNQCDGCDNCQTVQAEEHLEDMTIPAQKFLSCVKRTGEMFGVSYIIDVLRGSRQARILQNRHDQLSTYNIGGEYSKTQWQLLAQQFIQQGLLLQDMAHGSLKLTPQAYAVFRGEHKVLVRIERPSAATTLTDDYDTALFDLLRRKRKELADAANVPPYVIFSDRTLIEMVTYLPHSATSFATLSGVGEVKLQKYADEFLPLIRAYGAANGLAEKRRSLSGVSGSSGKGERTTVVGEAYNAGQDIEAIAAAMGVQPRTIIGHLWKYVQQGNALQHAGSLLESSALSEAEQARVLACFTEFGPEYLRPVYEALGETISYDELHLLRLAFVATSASRGQGNE